MTALLRALHSPWKGGLGYVLRLSSQIVTAAAGRGRSVGIEKEPLPAKEALNSNMTAPNAPLEHCKICRR